jgi:hypothetical protein
VKRHAVLGAALALALGARGAPAQVSPAAASSALTSPAIRTIVPTTLSLIAPDALAGLDFGLGVGYGGSFVNLAPRGWVRGPGFYRSPWGGPYLRHRWVQRTVWYQPRTIPSSPPPTVRASETPKSSSPGITVPVQLHGGFFDHDENAPRSYAAGLRAGPAIDKHLQIGLGVDWYHRTDSEKAVVAETLQAGQPVTVTRVISQASSDLIPIQAFLQLSVGKGLVPYAGIAGEYQFLLLDATDNVTGAGYSATFGGLGWQAWGGLGFDVGRSRLFGEVFINAGDVERDINDPAGGPTLRETINADGGGARFGLSWGF